MFDLVLKDGSHYNIIKWRADNGRPLKTADYFIDFAILDHAFRHRMEGREFSVSYFVYDFTSVNKGFNLVKVDPENYNALKYWCQTIIEESAFAPRRGLTTHCKTCHFDEPCSQYVITPSMISGKALVS